MKDLYNEICEWQHKQFPNATTNSKLKHLEEEIQELIETPERHSEYADCFMLLMGAFENNGGTYEELVKAIKDKFETNKNRVWGEPDEHGVVKHIDVPDGREFFNKTD